MEKVYSALDDANTAYLLKKGKLFLEITEGSYFEIIGENLIFGAVEVILNFDNVIPTYRLFNVFKEEGTELSNVKPVLT